jgi:hypothetical protein
MVMPMIVVVLMDVTVSVFATGSGSFPSGEPSGCLQKFFGRRVVWHAYRIGGKFYCAIAENLD